MDMPEIPIAPFVAQTVLNILLEFHGDARPRLSALSEDPETAPAPRLPRRQARPGGGAD